MKIFDLDTNNELEDIYVYLKHGDIGVLLEQVKKILEEKKSEAVTLTDSKTATQVSIKYQIE